MADPSAKKGNESTVPDPIARAYSQSLHEPADDDDEKVIEEIRPGRHVDLDQNRREAGDNEDGNRKPELAQVKSYASATSVATAPSGKQQIQKPWYEQPNPLRWGKIPPVPTEKEPSREYKASFFSSLFFHWMGPLMRVS